MFALSLSEPLHIRSFHAALPGLAYAASRIVNAQLNIAILDLRSDLDLHHFHNELAMDEFALAHRESPRNCKPGHPMIS